MKRIYKKIVNLLSKTPLKKSKILLNIDAKIRSRLKPEFIITKDGYKMFLDKQDNLRLSLCNEGDKGDKFELDIIKDTVKEGDVVLDVGGHIGFYTLVFSKLVGETGKVYTFEPNPDNFAILKKNIEVNNIKNVILVNKALSDKEGKLKLYLNKDNSGGHSLYQQNASNDFVEVDVLKLDNYFRGSIKKIDFIKMDAEGSEGHIFQGASKLIKKNPKIKILTEFSPIYLENSGFGKVNFLKMLKNLNFNILNIDMKEEKLVLTDARELLKDDFVKNILCEK